MPKKPKNPQVKTPTISQGRDCFQTPNYATELLIPFIPKHLTGIWEPAAGQGKIVNVLRQHGYSVIGTDIIETPEIDGVANFFNSINDATYHCLITNPPFSMKKEFYEACFKKGLPFALLIPADYSAWIIQSLRNGCEKIIPTRRIDYITPNGKSGKNSASQFHSMWLTYGFGLGKSETFVDLTPEMKKNI